MHYAAYDNAGWRVTVRSRKLDAEAAIFGRGGTVVPVDLNSDPPLFRPEFQRDPVAMKHRIAYVHESQAVPLH